MSGGCEEGVILDIVTPSHPMWERMEKLGLSGLEDGFSYLVRWRHVNYLRDPNQQFGLRESLTASNHIYGKATTWWRFWNGKHGNVLDKFMPFIRIFALALLLLVVGWISHRAQIALGY